VVKELIDWTKKERTRLYFDSEHYVEGRVIVSMNCYRNHYAFLTNTGKKIHITRRGKNDRVRASGTRTVGDIAFVENQCTVGILDDSFEIVRRCNYQDLGEVVVS